LKQERYEGQQAFEAENILRPAASFQGMRTKILTGITADSLIVREQGGYYSHTFCQSEPSQSSCIIPQLIMGVGHNNFCIVFKELYFLKTKANKHKKNQRYVHKLNINKK
jgi:hypothetical protein